jgi:F-type H+-transporting ATPase subunit b
LSAKRQEALRKEADQLKSGPPSPTQQEFFAIARKALTDLAGTSLEERMGEVFTRACESWTARQSRARRGPQDSVRPGALVRSAFELPAEQRAAIQAALNETFSTEVHVRFETAPDLISGIELTTNGQKVAGASRIISRRWKRGRRTSQSSEGQ